MSEGEVNILLKEFTEEQLARERMEKLKAEEEEKRRKEEAKNKNKTPNKKTPNNNPTPPPIPDLTEEDLEELMEQGLI